MQSDNSIRSPLAFRQHRLALAPAHPDASAEIMRDNIESAFSEGEERFIAFLRSNNLGPVWYQALHDHALQDCISSASLGILKSSRFAVATLYLLQNAVMRQIDRLFESRGIAYAVIKGVHVRELVYSEPSLRQAKDIDILVSAGQRIVAAEALVEAGFQYNLELDNISHQASFDKAGVNIDLHWNILRPGRTRFDVTDALIARRRRIGGFWGLGDTDAVFLMLVHPAFNKYVCSPYMSLCRVMDFIRWMKFRSVDWDAVASLLHDTGLQTAAWTMLHWFTMLGLAVPDNLMAKIQPGRVRMRYLSFWLEHDLPTKWLYRRPLLIQIGLTLFLHDRPLDAGRMILGWFRAYLQRHRDIFVLQQALNSP
ncbi:MAG: nucleotidyltransferase family protein [Methylococcaceae bacterium]|nr:nucleotidyltransferase family protein [Methylococcaceae bacterium]